MHNILDLCFDIKCCALRLGVILNEVINENIGVDLPQIHCIIQIETLLEIWRDYREETLHVKPMSKLPEPPGLRDRLVQEIQFFVDSVKEKAKNQGV